MTTLEPRTEDSGRRPTWPAGTETIAISALKPYPRNARTHSRRQIKKIAASINRFGFVNPVLIDEGNRIIAGHGRVAAVKLLGWREVPTLRIEHLDEAEKRAYILADNRIAEEAGWDRETLAIELQGLIDLDFSIELTGFGMAEVDLLLDGEAAAKAPDRNTDDDIPPLPAPGTAITRPGDLWRLGQHRLFCGDATAAASYARLLGGAKAALIFTDPPYNVPIDGHVSGLGKVRHREFAMASGEMTSEEFRSFLESVFGHMAAHSADGSIHFVCMDWRHMAETLAAGESAYTELKNLCVWVKSNGGMGTFYRSRHELVLAFKSGTAAHINNFELGQTGRYRTNVWEYAGVNSFGRDRDLALAMHPTVKPVTLVADAMRDCSKRRQIVLDPFAGSGTTVIAAQKTGRRAYVLELDPLYCDTIIRRWQAFSGKRALHGDTGRCFEETGELRMAEAADAEAPSPDDGGSSAAANQDGTESGAGPALATDPTPHPQFPDGPQSS
jgi:16S rRNA G966 N2-methylase RsmD